MRLPLSRRSAAIAALATFPLTGAGVASATTPPSEPTDTTLSSGSSASDDTSMTASTVGDDGSAAAAPTGPSGPLCAAATDTSAATGTMATGDAASDVTAPDDTMSEATTGGDTAADPATADTSAGTTTAGSATADTTTATGGSTMADSPVASAAGMSPLLTDLVSAIDAAGLADTLDSGGPFTVLAPVNSAFAKVPAADLDAALADPGGLLSSVLSYHVIPEQLSSVDLAAGGSFESVLGEELTFELRGETLVVNDGAAAVQCMDLPTANATVYLIDTVLMPPSSGTDATSATTGTTATSDAGATATTTMDSMGSVPTETTEA